jgi:hypothetical protein
MRAVKAGATKEEIIDALGVAIMVNARRGHGLFCAHHRRL